VRYTRGLFQSLGASGSLLAAAACALFAVSAAVGFHGWPGLPADAPGARDLVVAQGSAPRPRVQFAGRPSAVAPHRVLAATEPIPARRSAAARRGSVQDTRVSAPLPAATPAPAAAAPAASGAPAPAVAPSSPGGAVTRPVAETVRDAGQTVGATVAPVSPTAAQTVTTATDTVAGVVDKTGAALAP
jgi:hypothetical protein